MQISTNKQIPRNFEKLFSFHKPPFPWLRSGANLCAGRLHCCKYLYSSQDMLDTKSKINESKNVVYSCLFVLMDLEFLWNFQLHKG